MTDFDSRPREVLCCVAGCQEITGSYIDAREEAWLLARFPLCGEHESDWRAGYPFRLDATRVNWHLVKGDPESSPSHRIATLDQGVTDLRAEVAGLKAQIAAIHAVGLR